MNAKRLIIAFSIGPVIGMALSIVVAAPPLTPAATRPARPTPPTRDPTTPGFVPAKELPDGVNPPIADGNFIIGPTHNRAPESTVQQRAPQGTEFTFTTNLSLI